MADRDVLTQEEIDALLTSVDTGSVAGEDAGAEEPADVRPYDLTSQDRIVRGRLPTLELLGEKFARQLRTDLQDLLRYSVTVGAGGVQVVSYAELSSNLYVPTSITLTRMAPLVGHGLIAIDAKLVFRMVDQYFGGDGKNISIEGRDFTPTEKRIIGRVLEVVYRGLSEAWGEVIPISIETVTHEINPALLNTFSSDEAMMVNTYHIELESGGGEIHVSVPYASLEPYKHLLDTSGRPDDVDQDSSWSPGIQARLLSTEVPLHCAVAEKRIKLRDLLTLKVGDVIEVDMPENHLVLAGEVPAFYAKLGESRGNLALEFRDNVARG